jgi:hypothetical protein
MTPKLKTYTRKDDGTVVVKKGRWILLEVFKRPHGWYSCSVFNKGKCVSFNGYHVKCLPTISSAKKWGISKAEELKII